MQPVTPNASHYDRRTIFFHWATFALVVLQFVVAWTIDDFPSGALRVDARSVHITLGLLLAVVLLARIVWRATEGRRLPAADHGAKHIVAKGTHWGLYLLLLAMVALGITLTWARGDSIYNLFSIPSFAPGNRALSNQIQEWHGDIGWIIIAVAGLHAAAALAHRFLWRNGVLNRMAVGWRGAAGGD